MRDVPWQDIFKLSASTTVTDFCDWFKVKTDVYIPHCKYQVKPNLSLWFSGASTAARVHSNLFFCLYQHNKSSSKVKFRPASNHCERVLEAPNLIMLIKQESIIS